MIGSNPEIGTVESSVKNRCSLSVLRESGDHPEKECGNNLSFKEEVGWG